MKWANRAEATTKKDIILALADGIDNENDADDLKAFAKENGIPYLEGDTGVVENEDYYDSDYQDSSCW